MLDGYTSRTVSLNAGVPQGLALAFVFKFYYTLIELLKKLLMI